MLVLPFFFPELFSLRLSPASRIIYRPCSSLFRSPTSIRITSSCLTNISYCSRKRLDLNFSCRNLFGKLQLLAVSMRY
jgi:hypothetical protein